MTRALFVLLALGRPVFALSGFAVRAPEALWPRSAAPGRDSSAGKCLQGTLPCREIPAGT